MSTFAMSNPQTTTSSGSAEINPEKLVFKTENYKGVNMIYMKPLGLQSGEDLHSIMSNFAQASKKSNLSMSIIDLREMKATLNKNILEIAKFQDDIKSVRMQVIVFKNESLKGLSNIIAMFGGYQVMDVTLDNYNEFLQRVNKEHKIMVLTSAVENPNDAHELLKDPFDPYNQMYKDFAEAFAKVNS